jgi:hypothetical protein
MIKNILHLLIPTDGLFKSMKVQQYCQLVADFSRCQWCILFKHVLSDIDEL